MPNLFQVLLAKMTQPDAQQQLFDQKVAGGMMPSEATRQIYGQGEDISLPSQNRQGGLLPSLLTNLRHGQAAYEKMSKR